MWWYGGAVLAGCLGGGLFVFLYRKIISPGFSRTYWKGVGRNIQGLFTGDEEKFWSYYWALAKETLRYVGIQLIGIFFALVPVTVFMLFAWPGLHSTWNRDPSLVVYPKNAGTLLIEKKGHSTTPFSHLGPHLVQGDSHPGSIVLKKRFSI